MEQRPSQFRPDLGRLDFTLLVIGAVIGADVYVVASMGAQFLGPAQLVAWLTAGALAGVIALAFVQCAAIDSDVGGPYAYARSAFGPLAGFLAGWALYVGEWVALPVFPLAFVNYLEHIVPGLPGPAALAVKVALVAGVTGANLLGVRKGASINDVLAIAKLLPLAVLIVLALAFAAFRPHLATGHLQPFAPLGWGGFGHAVLPIFWAYAGFELAVLPAGEVRDPRRTLPQGLILGMLVATVFYLLTAFTVVAALPWGEAAGSTSPLAAAMTAILDGLGVPSGAGGTFMSIGALVSIAGVYEAFTLGVARLSYALAADGLFPRPFASIHPRFGTPHVGLAFQAGTALIGATLFGLGGLITIAVLFLGVAYLLTALAALRLVSRNPEQALRIPGLKVWLLLAAASAVYLSAQASRTQMAIGAAVMLAGFVLYAVRGAHWRGLAIEVGERERQAARWAEHEYLWLLRPVQRALRWLRGG